MCAWVWLDVRLNLSKFAIFFFFILICWFCFSLCHIWTGYCLLKTLLVYLFPNAFCKTIFKCITWQFFDNQFFKKKNVWSPVISSISYREFVMFFEKCAHFYQAWLSTFNLNQLGHFEGEFYLNKCIFTKHTLNANNFNECARSQSIQW